MSEIDNLPVRLDSEPCRVFLRHWMALPKTGVVPDGRDLLDSSPPALMPHVTIQEVMPQGLLVRFFGTELERRWRRDLTGCFFGQDYPSQTRARLYSNALQIVGHPCGLHQIVEVLSNAGHEMHSEVVLLPLAVGVGRAPRIVGFSHALDALGREEFLEAFKHNTRNEWFDVGAGTPTRQPHSH